MEEGGCLEMLELSSLDCSILQLANESVVNLDFVIDSIKKNFNNKISKKEVINSLEELKKERLIFISDDYLEIVSIININFVI